MSDIEKQEENYGMEKYGNALRYGKYAVINIVSRKFREDLDVTEYNCNVKEATEQVLYKWKDFENKIIKKQSNNDYFYKYKEEDNIRTIYNFDGYYKGKTINKDLEDFDFDI